MRTTILVAFVALAFTAALAAPQHSHHVVAKQAQPTIVSALAHKNTRDLIDLVSSLLGIDIKLIAELIPRAIEDVEAALTVAVQGLGALLGGIDETIAARLDVLIAVAIAEAVRIVGPLLDVLAPIIGSGRSIAAVTPKDILDDLLLIIVGLTLQEIVDLISTTVTGLQTLFVDTVAEIQALALAVSAELVADVNTIINETLAAIQVALQPLLDALAPIINPPTKAVSVREAVHDLIDLISIIIGVDVRAVLDQANITIAEVEVILTSTVGALIDLVADADAALTEELNVVVAGALAEAQTLVEPLLTVLAPVLVEGHCVATGKDLIDDLLQACLGISTKQLVELTTRTLIGLEQLLGATVAELERVAGSISAEVDLQVQVLLNQALNDIAASVQKLVDLLAPLLPGGRDKVIGQPRLGLEELIDLISAALGVDIRPILVQAELTAAGVKAALNSADAEITALLGKTELLARITEIQQQATREAEAIVQRVIDLVLGGAAVEAILEATQVAAAELQNLALRTIGQAQEVVAEAGDLVPALRDVLRRLLLEVNKQVAPLLDLLTPLIPTARATLRLKH